jgi:hypothetical protein
MKIRKNKILLSVTALFFIGSLTKAQELFVEPNYHPHDDKNPAWKI